MADTLPNQKYLNLSSFLETFSQEYNERYDLIVMLGGITKSDPLYQSKEIVLKEEIIKKAQIITSIGKTIRKKINARRYEKSEWEWCLKLFTDGRKHSSVKQYDIILNEIHYKVKQYDER